MPNEVLGQTQGEVGEVQEAPSPTTLAEAFGMLREADKQDTAGAVEPQDNDIAAAPAEPAADLGGPEPEPAAGVEPDEGALGGSDDLTSFDPNPARQNLIQQANTEAVRQTREMFEKQGVRLMDIADLYERDENSGRVTFRNPDDPNRPFASRYEAQQFVDSINKQINSRYQKELRAQQQKILQGMAPQFALLEFAPVYNSMSQDERDVFDAIIAPYSIYNDSGAVIGFNVNLQAAGAQAKQIAQKFASRQPAPSAQPQQQEKEKAKPTTPALDMPQASGTADDEEPKTLEEAFNKLSKMKKGK